ncbi:type II secretion system F family protein [Companilactobacillus sp. FL22-1]|uniref:type II secretion system F family protein n=1 Tax=Companilactobacillus sp. FL22-1 TaxID=3373892 RepID=UPI003754A0DD
MKKLINNFSTAKKIKRTQQAEYLLIISKLLRNGFSLSQSINCLRLLDLENKVLERINNDLHSGKMLSQALQHLQLPSVIYNQLIIAQEHGNIALAIEQTGQLMQTQTKQKNKLKELLIYPCFILAFLLTMLVGMKLFIIPQLQVAGGGKNIDLFLGLLLGIILFTGIAFVIFSWKMHQKAEYQRAQILVKLPFVGKIYLNFFQFIILQGLGMQLASGMNLYEICESNNRFQKDSIQAFLASRFIDNVMNGQGLLNLIEEEILLPKQLRVLLEAGESGTQLADDLLLLAELKFEETSQGLKKILNMIQPVLFGVIAIVVIATYLMILLPIYGMMRGMS